MAEAKGANKDATAALTTAKAEAEAELEVGAVRCGAGEKADAVHKDAANEKHDA